MFKARFTGWDDVLAVDYTLSADYVANASKQLGVTVIESYYVDINLRVFVTQRTSILSIIIPKEYTVVSKIVFKSGIDKAKFYVRFFGHNNPESTLNHVSSSPKHSFSFFKLHLKDHKHKEG